MKRIIIAILALFLVAGINDLQAQSKGTGKKTNTSKSSKSKKPAPKPKPADTPLPANSNDCIFAIELQPDVIFGPTTAPQGAGRVQDVMRDKNNPYVFEYEHNSVWYKFTVPYNGNLEIAITQNNPKDNYDFLVYKYTDNYFSNRIIEGKVKPVAACLNAVDSAAKAGTPQLGMKKDATKLFIDSKSREGFVKSIPVRKGEVYYIALDNQSANGSGHSIKVSIQVESFEPTIIFWDNDEKKRVEVDLLILEKNTDNRPIVKNAHYRGGKVKFVPGFNYTLYAKKDGYFSVYKEFNSNVFREDTLLRVLMNKTVKGTTFPISDVYFDDNGDLLPESDTALMNYISMFRNHNDITFQVKGFVQSYGVDLQRDMQLSLKRAQSVKNFFVQHGIADERITVAGMSQNEIKRSAAAALNKGQAFSATKIKLVITGIQP